MAAPYYGSSSHIWSDIAAAGINELRFLAEELAAAKTKEEFQRTYQRMQAEIADITKSGKRWASTDLLTDYRSAYSEFGMGAIPKRFVDAAYRQRRKAAAGVDNLNRNLNAWARSAAENAAGAASARGLRAEERRLTTLITNAKRDKSPPAAVNKWRAELADKRRQIQQLPDTTGGREVPGVRYLARKGPAKGLTYRSIDADAYARLLAETHHRLAGNTGNLAGLTTRKGRKFVYVSDGPDCGWIHHRDPNKANGQRVTLEEAMAHPIAHPHCQRAFWPDKPTAHTAVSRTTALNTSEKSVRENIAKAIQQLDRDEIYKKPKSLSDMFALASTVGSAVYRVQVIARSPLVRRFALGILQDSEGQLPPMAEKFLQRLVGYDASDALAMRAYGRALGTSERMAFRERVMADTDTALAQNVGAEPLETVDIPEHVRVAMRLRKGATRDEVIAAYKDYFDYHDYLKAADRSWWENLEEKIFRMRAADATVGQQGQAAAIQLHLSNPVSERMNTSWRILMRSTASSAARNKEYLRRELTKVVAELVPSPFPGKSLGDLKFTIGMSQKGRIDLATKLYDQLRGGIRWTPKDIAWAEQLGLKLPVAKKITRDDIIQALLPRITWEPGPMFNATVALEQGKIIPLFRAYPPGTWRKWLAMDMRLRSGAVEHVIQEIRTAYGENSLDRELIQKILHGYDVVVKPATATREAVIRHVPGLIEDTITNFWFWKDGPLEGNLRFYGRDVAQYGAIFQPDSGLIRITHRWKAASPTLAYYDKAKDQLVFYTDEDGNIVRFGSHMSSLNVLPNFGPSLAIQLRDQNFTMAMMHYHIWHGNLMGISKDTRYGYDQLLEWWNNLKAQVGDYRKIVTREEIASIRTWEDFTRFVQEIKFRTRSLHQEAKNDALVQQLTEVISEDDLIRAHPALQHDLQEWLNVMRLKFPGIDPPHIRIVDIKQEHELMFRDGELLIRADVARDWTEFQNVRSRGVDVGLFPAGTYDRVANLYHEEAHHIIERMTVGQLRGVWSRVGRSLEDSDDHWPGGKEGMNNFPFDDLRNSYASNSKEGINRIIALWMDKGSRLSVAQKDLPNRPAGTTYWSVGAVRRKILRSLSGYAARSPDEFIAEAFSEYMTSPNPRPIALAVGRYIESIFGRSPLTLLHPSQVVE